MPFPPEARSAGPAPRLLPVGLPEKRELRVGDAEREAVVAQLRTHLGAGRLTLDEFEERTGHALAARTVGDLVPLTADLPSVRPTGPKGPPVRQPDRRPAHGWELAWRIHLRLVGAISAVFLLVAVVFLESWPFWVVFGLLISVAAHGAVKWSVRG